MENIITAYNHQLISNFWVMLGLKYFLYLNGILSKMDDSVLLFYVGLYFLIICFCSCSDELMWEHYVKGQKVKSVWCSMSSILKAYKSCNLTNLTKRQVITRVKSVMK